MIITSLNNSKVKEWLKLKEKKERDKREEFLIEGDHLTSEALKKGIIKEVISCDSALNIPGLPFYEVTPEIIKKISSQVTSTKIICVCKKMVEKAINGNICILDNIQDPGNLGTIIRSAVAFNINTLILSPDTVDLYNEKVIRASEGMIFHLNYQRKSCEEAIQECHHQGYKIYGTDVKNGKDLKEIAFNQKSVIIIGNEGNGMREELKKDCDELIHISISPQCESLNAAIAASIIFYATNT